MCCCKLWSAQIISLPVLPNVRIPAEILYKAVAFVQLWNKHKSSTRSVFWVSAASLAAGSCLCPDVGGNLHSVYCVGSIIIKNWLNCRECSPNSEVCKVSPFYNSAFLPWGLYGPCVYLCSCKMMVLTSHLYFVGMKNTRAQRGITVIIEMQKNPHQPKNKLSPGFCKDNAEARCKIRHT